MAAIDRLSEVRLYAKQLAFCRSPKLYRAFRSGIGAGKSWIGAHDLAMRAVHKKSRTYMVATPTYTMMKDITLPTFLSVAGEGTDTYPGLNILAGPPKGGDRPDVTLLSGSVVRFRSADKPDSMRGPNLSGIWMDEASLMDEEAYHVAIGRLREGGEQGWLSATYTPQGLAHWTARIFNNRNENTEVFVAHTIENPFNPPGFAENLARQYGPLRARQELGGEEVAIAGAEWPGEWFTGNIWFDEWPMNKLCRSMALDPSLGKKKEIGDDSAIALVQLQPDGYLYVDVDMEVRPTDEIVRRYIDLANSFHPDWAGIEDNLFQVLLAEDIDAYAKKTGCLTRMYGVNNQLDKLVRIRRLTPFLSQGDIRFKRGSRGAEKLVAQLRDFPMGKHDDGPDALEMAIRLMHEQMGATATDNLKDYRLTDEH